MKIPLAEHFHSIQGEGHWVGTPMHFIRLAGCSVGVRVPPTEELAPGITSASPTLPSGKKAWLCNTWDHRPFWCDTDFNKYEEVELSDLLSETWEEHICLTGGEPLIHPEIVEVFSRWAIETDRKTLHIETSGTIDFEKRLWVWLTVSPKFNSLQKVVDKADEIKLLIDSQAKDDFYPFLSHPKVYLSPINDAEGTISQESFKRTLELLRSHPSWRLSVQLHKYIGVR